MLLQATLLGPLPPSPPIPSDAERYRFLSGPSPMLPICPSFPPNGLEPPPDNLYLIGWFRSKGTVEYSCSTASDGVLKLNAHGWKGQIYNLRPTFLSERSSSLSLEMWSTWPIRQMPFGQVTFEPLEISGRRPEEFYAGRLKFFDRTDPEKKPFFMGDSNHGTISDEDYKNGRGFTSRMSVNGRGGNPTALLALHVTAYRVDVRG